MWLGDFNFRIDLPNDEVRWRCTNNDVASLLTFDQV